MGFFEIIGIIWEFIVGIIGGLFVSNSVTFGTPTISSNNAATLKKVNSSTYTVNKSDTLVAMPFVVKGYKSFVWTTTSATSGEYNYKSSCTNITGNSQEFPSKTLTVKSSDKYAREGKVIAYEDANCTGSSKEYKTAKVLYKAETPTALCNFTSGSTTYSSVCDKSNGGYKNIGTQGHSTDTCNCYAKAYALSMLGLATLNPNVSDATKCWTSNWTGNYYVVETGNNDRTTSSNMQDIFNVARNELKNGRPTMVLVYNSTGAYHWLLIKAIKQDSLNKTSLSYSDFWVVDSVGSSKSPDVNEDPVEKNWQSLIDSKSGNNRELRDGSSTNQYEIVQLDK